tara:strand:+ start:3339 stop:3578 length:240 start_codon:yes stop_codon:yes gene_type:complete
MSRPTVDNGYMVRHAIDAMPTYDLKLAVVHKLAPSLTAEQFVEAIKYANAAHAQLTEPEEVKHVECVVLDVLDVKATKK